MIEPFYPKARPEGGWRPVDLERMLRIHLLQQWYALSDSAVEEALYDSASMRRFVGIDLGREPAPEETTVCKFHHLLEEHGLARELFKAVNRHLHDKGLKLSRGTIVDATIIAAAPSTKNKTKARDPAMHRTKTGQQWYLGMKAHIGVDEATGLVPSPPPARQIVMSDRPHRRPNKFVYPIVERCLATMHLPQVHAGELGGNGKNAHSSGSAPTPRQPLVAGGESGTFSRPGRALHCSVRIVVADQRQGRRPGDWSGLAWHTMR